MIDPVPSMNKQIIISKQREREREREKLAANTCYALNMRMHFHSVM